MSKKKDLQEAARLLMDMGMIIVSIDYKSGTITCKPIPEGSTADWRCPRLRGSHGKLRPGAGLARRAVHRDAQRYPLYA